jgi:hypothetical protein
VEGRARRLQSTLALLETVVAGALWGLWFALIAHKLWGGPSLLEQLGVGAVGLVGCFVGFAVALAGIGLVDRALRRAPSGSRRARLLNDARAPDYAPLVVMLVGGVGNYLFR